MVIVACCLAYVGELEHASEPFLSTCWSASFRIREFGLVVQMPQVHETYQRWQAFLAQS